MWCPRPDGGRTWGTKAPGSSGHYIHTTYLSRDCASVEDLVAHLETTEIYICWCCYIALLYMGDVWLWRVSCLMSFTKYARSVTTVPRQSDNGKEREKGDISWLVHITAMKSVVNGSGPPALAQTAAWPSCSPSSTKKCSPSMVHLPLCDAVGLSISPHLPLLKQRTPQQCPGRVRKQAHYCLGQLIHGCSPLPLARPKSSNEDPTVSDCHY